MYKTIFFLLFCVTILQNSYCFYGNFSGEVTKSVKEILAKWEKKELDLDDGCAKQLNQFLENLLTFDDGLWALKMIDAAGKFPSGLARGNIVMMGSFDECLDIRSEAKNITGNYCSISIQTSITSDSSTQEAFTKGQELGSLPLYGICLPDRCSARDINNALPLVTSVIPLTIHCQTKDQRRPSLDTGAIVTITLLSVTAGLMVLSTFIDYISQGREIKPHPILISFSVYTNGQRLFRMRSGQGELACLNGIRFLSMCWVIYGHVFLISMLGPQVNLLDILDFLKETEAMFYLGIAHAVDSFFVLSGLLVAYNFMKKMKKGEKFNIFTYYIHRYLRLTPAYGVGILCSIYLINYLGTGPVFTVIDTQVVKLCKELWWKALLYFQNFIEKSEGLCMAQTWNLSIDFQLYLVSPIFLFCLYKTPRFGTLLMSLPIIGCMTAGYVLTRKYKLGVFALMEYTSVIDFMRYYYVKTYTRAPTWFIGAWLGYVLGRIKFFNDKTHLKIPRVVFLLVWLVVLALVPVCVFGFHDELVNPDYNITANSLYNAFVRPIWGLCVAWIIFACTVGYGGIINDFLSLPIFGVLSKFTYCMYLVHLPIFYIMILSRKVPGYFSRAEMLNQFFALFAVSFVVSIFWILAFEMPILIIEPYIFGHGGKSSTNKQNNNEATSNEEESRYKNEMHLKVKNRLTPTGPIIEIQP